MDSAATPPATTARPPPQQQQQAAEERAASDAEVTALLQRPAPPPGGALPLAPDLLRLAALDVSRRSPTPYSASPASRCGAAAHRLQSCAVVGGNRMPSAPAAADKAAGMRGASFGGYGGGRSILGDLDSRAPRIGLVNRPHLALPAGAGARIAGHRSPPRLLRARGGGGGGGGGLGSGVPAAPPNVVTKGGSFSAAWGWRPP
jgi:hypothetical protein